MGYWLTHEYHRRNVESGVQKFDGWNRIAGLVARAKKIGDERATPTGDRDAALLAALFLGGFRAGECVKEKFPRDDFVSGLTKQNVQILQDSKPPIILFDNVKTLKAHRKIKDSDWWEKPEEKKGHHYQSKRMPLQRTFPIPLDEPKEVMEPFLAYLKPLNREDFLFPITPTRAYQIVEAIDQSVWPHWFRAQRASQLSREYGFKLHELMEFFQWKEMKTALRYASMGYSALLEKLPIGNSVARVW